MLIKNWMTSPVITIDAGQPLKDGLDQFQKQSINLLPVLKDNKLAGLLFKDDMKIITSVQSKNSNLEQARNLLMEVKIEQVMTQKPITIPEDYTMEEAAEILMKNNLAGAPITDHSGKMIGLISKNEICKNYIDLSGISKRGVLFAFILDDIPGSIKRITEIIRQHKGRLLSIMSTYSGMPQGYRKVYIRAFQIDRKDLEKLTTELKASSNLQYMIDHRYNHREFFTKNNS